MLMRFTIYNYQFTFNSQFSILSEAIWQMTNVKLLNNAKCKTINVAGGDGR